MQRFTVFFLTILSLVLECTISALAFTFTTIDPPGSIATTASAINARGLIVGAFMDSNGEQHGFLRNTNGKFTTIEVHGPFFSSTSTVALSINKRGQVVGVFGFNNAQHGFLDNEGSLLPFTIIDPPGSTFAGANSINSLGQIVGSFDDSNGEHGFLAVP